MFFAAVKAVTHVLVTETFSSARKKFLGKLKCPERRFGCVELETCLEEINRTVALVSVS